MKKRQSLLTLLCIASMLLWGCDKPKQQTMPETNTTTKSQDSHSFAGLSKAIMNHLSLDVNVDFDKKVISGAATIKLNSNGSNKLFLDTKDLTIANVTQDGKDIPFVVHDAIPHLGSALEIDISSETKSVTVEYQSSPTAEAVQWLNPQQTSGKKQPFLFTQSQAILARSWVPCQDSPGIRFTYDAKIKVPKELMALMSAENPTEKNDTGVYTFKMRQAIPAYLLALAVGDVAYASVGEHTGVYAEHNMLEKSKYEFAKMEDMLVAAEKLYGKYQWEQYDLIVLPPSFPFGGMENPRLTFATPTILAGDRSLTSLVAHELAHSWSGNLATNATWDDFWLNEGFTTYFENRIMEAVYGKSIADMLALIGYRSLQDEVESLNASSLANDTKLKLNLKDRNPDDGMTAIAYDKGFFFLKLIENTVGREKWDAFLNKYFSEFAFKTIDTEQFIAYLKANLLDGIKGAEEKIDINAWVYSPGVPDNCPQIKSDRFAKVEAEVKSFVSGTKPEKLKSKEWVYQEWVHFLSNLPEKLTAKQMKSLDKAFKLSDSGNNEVLFQWLLHVIRNEYKTSYPQLEKFLITVGRRKFVKPLFDEMVKNGNTIPLAKKIYKKSRGNYHFVTYTSIDQVLEGK